MRLLWCLLLFPAAVSAQSVDAMTADALKNLKTAWSENAHYTYLDTEHDHSFIDNKFNEDRTKVSETIFLEGAPYTRLLSVNGKPLSGKALAREQAMYDQAVRERRSVDAVKAEHARHFSHSVSDELDRIPHDFEHRVVGHESVGGHACVILLFEPKPGATPALTQKYTFWIDEKDHQVLRYDRELLAAEDKLLPGSISSYRFVMLDGVMVVSETRMDFSWDEAALHNKRIHLIATHTFTNYRRFRTSVTIGPATVIPENPQ